MHQSKNLAIAFLFGAVLVGGALGFSADRVLTRDRHRGRSIDLLDSRLDLSDQQRSQINSILDERQRQFMVVYEPVRPKMDSIRLHARDQMRQVLNAEQRVKFEALLKELTDSTKRRDE
jgi:Spy/CpxP family protein refolding chaperone